MDPKIKLILGLIWTIILRYQISTTGDASGSPKQQLLQWVQSKIPEYNVKDFVKSWSDGKAIMVGWLRLLLLLHGSDRGSGFRR